MGSTPYKRVDLERLESHAAETAATTASTEPRTAWLRWMLFVLPLAVLLCLLQAWAVVLGATYSNVYISSTLITVIGFGSLMLIVLLVNPFLHYVLRGVIAPLSRAELVSIFATLLVSSGISTFGLTSQLVPIIQAPWNPAWNTPQRGWDEQLLPYLHPNLYLTDAEEVRVVRHGVAVPQPPESAAMEEKIDYLVDVFDAIPWWTYLRPLTYWLVFVVASYGMFYSLSFVVLRYWSRREKLIFPLVQLPQTLLPAHGRLLPPAFRSPLFWAGFMVAMGFLSWNASVTAGWIAGLTDIPWGMNQERVNELSEGTAFEGLSLVNSQAPGTLQFMFGFVAIGIAFLLPTEISFSVWFYYLVGVAVVVVGSWMNFTDFRSDWLWKNNPTSGLGAGGMLCFSAVSLWKAVSDHVRLGAGRSVAERLKLAAPVVGLFVCIAVMIAWLMRFGVNPESGTRLNFLFAFLFVAVTTLVTLGLMRIVAEGGIYWFQSHLSFFHVYRMLGLGKFSLLKTAALGPLVPVYWVLFLDLKTFMAPNLLNAARMQQDEHAHRGRFHATIAIGIVVSLAAALGMAIFLCYMRGGNQMSDWFYTSGPAQTMDTARNAIREAPRFDGATTAWYVTGAVWVMITMVARQFLFWFPHPIGFIMLINPWISPVWMSFFIGWACKRLVVKYGGKATYDTVKLFFIGLIMGEIMAVFIWPALGVIFDFATQGIDLNRMG